MIDDKLFPDPDRFNPHRFLDPDGKTLMNLEAVVPFSMGKRSCLGEGLAKMELFLVFGTLIQKFRFSPIGGVPTAEPSPGFVRAPQPYRMTVTIR